MKVANIAFMKHLAVGLALRKYAKMIKKKRQALPQFLGPDGNFGVFQNNLEQSTMSHFNKL